MLNPNSDILIRQCDDEQRRQLKWIWFLKTIIKKTSESVRIEASLASGHSSFGGWRGRRS